MKKVLRKSSGAVGLRRQPTPTMNAAKITKLLQIKTAKYTADGNMHPELAAQFDVESFIQMVSGQPQYADQLIDEEIEDSIKAGLARGLCAFA
jgi:hypothetical protein